MIAWLCLFSAGAAELRHCRMLREECLNENWFLSLDDAREKVEAWRQDYNNVRPHSALGQMVPARFARASIAGAKAAG